MKTKFMSFVPAALIAGVWGLGLTSFQEPVAAAEGNLVAQVDTVQFARGAKSWADTCARCHNMRDARSLRDDQWRAAVAHMRVRAGLTANEASDILAFLQQSNNVDRVETTAASMRISDSNTGKAVYAQTCFACHGDDGKGAIPGVSDLTEADGPLSKPDAVLLASISNGLTTPGAALSMPARGGNPAMTDDEIVAVLAYLHATFGKP